MFLETMMTGEGRSLDEILARLEAKAKPERKPLKPRPKTRWAGPNFVNVGRKRRERCKRGHPLTEDNVLITKAGHRRCKTCHLVYMRRYKTPKQRQAPVDPKGMYAGGTGSYLMSEDSVAKRPATWDEPYAQIEDQSEEIIRLAKQGRLGASRLGPNRTQPFALPLLRLEHAIDHEVKKGIPSAARKWAEEQIGGENEARGSVNGSSQASGQAERPAQPNQSERARTGRGPAAGECVRAIGRIQRSLVKARRTGQANQPHQHRNTG